MLFFCDHISECGSGARADRDNDLFDSVRHHIIDRVNGYLPDVEEDSGDDDVGIQVYEIRHLMSESIPTFADNIIIRLYAGIYSVMLLYPDIIEYRSDNKHERASELYGVDSEAHYDHHRGDDRVQQRGDNVCDRNDVVALIRLNDHLVRKAEEVLHKGAYREDKRQSKGKHPVKLIGNQKREKRGKNDDRRGKDQRNPAHKAGRSVYDRAYPLGIVLRERLIKRRAGNAAYSRFQQGDAAYKLRNGGCDSVVRRTEIRKDQARQNKAANSGYNFQNQLKAGIQ